MCVRFADTLIKRDAVRLFETTKRDRDQPRPELGKPVDRRSAHGAEMECQILTTFTGPDIGV